MNRCLSTAVGYTQRLPTRLQAAAAFSAMSLTGTLASIAAPDNETPQDKDADNVYEVTIQRATPLRQALRIHVQHSEPPFQIGLWAKPSSRVIFWLISTIGTPSENSASARSTVSHWQALQPEIAGTCHERIVCESATVASLVPAPCPGAVEFVRNGPDAWQVEQTPQPAHSR